MPAMGDDVSTDRGHGPLLPDFITCLSFKVRLIMGGDALRGTIVSGRYC